MGTILESTNELAKRFGVEGEMTIKDTLDAIVKKLDDTYTDSKDIAEAVSEFSKNDGPDARLGTKNITTNDTYTALDDDLDGYSSVTVEVPAPVLIEKNVTANDTYVAADDNADGYSSVTVNVNLTQTTEYSIQIPSSIVLPADKSRLYAIAPADGIIDNSNQPNPTPPPSYLGYKITGSVGSGSDNVVIFVSSPLKKFIYPTVNTNGSTIYFTPRADYDGFYSYWYHDNDKLTESGDTIVPGDGYVYKAEIDFVNGTATITKYTDAARSASVS